ncbi:MAG: PrsW family glutamic-type intramembrane protease [Candidatus Gracilibacteria bacterium]
MLETVIIYIILALISFFPIVIWAYIFSYIDDNPLNKKRFLVGVIGGGLSVVPILYMDNILEILNFKYLNIFYFVSEIKSLFTSFEFGLSMSLFLFVIVLFSFLFGGFVSKFREIIKIYLKNILVFLVFIAILSIVIFLLNIIFSKFDFVISEGIAFGDIVFNSFRLIVFYYILVAFIEETSKHFNFLQSSVLQIKSIKDGVLYAIFVALGFSLIENMLYLYSYYSVYGINGELLKIYFFRSAFSVIVHILSSSVVAYYFSKALLLYRHHDLSFSYLKIFSYGLLISILLHLFFDVALTLGFSFVMFIYFIGGYLYVSSIFYKEE